MAYLVLHIVVKFQIKNWPLFCYHSASHRNSKLDTWAYQSQGDLDTRLGYQPKDKQGYGNFFA